MDCVDGSNRRLSPAHIAPAVRARNSHMQLGHEFVHGIRPMQLGHELVPGISTWIQCKGQVMGK